MTGVEPRIRVLIADDESLARETLRLHLRQQSDIVIAGEASDGFRAVQLIETLRPDVLFLDIQMPDINGFDVLDALEPSQLPLVIFVTAHDQFAIKAFETHALDYLLKPFSRARFEDALTRVRLEFAPRGGSDLRRRLIHALEEHRRGQPSPFSGESEKYLKRLVVSHDRKIALVRVEDIDWIECCANYARLHVKGTSRLVRMAMVQLERRLDPGRFARIHRSTIVQIDRITEIAPVCHGDCEVTLVDGSKLRLSRKFKQRLQQ